MVQVSAAVWFGADGFEVTGVREERGEVVVWVQTPDGQRVFCDRCGRRARSKGRREVCLRDAPAAGGRPVRVRWKKRVWACPGRGCGAGSWTEQTALAGPRRVLTSRAVGWAVGRLEAVEGSVAWSARLLGVGWQTLWSAVRESAEGFAGDPARVGPVAQLGFDETAMASARRLRRRRFVTAAVDAATGQIVDIFDGRDAAEVRRWVQQQPRWWTDSVEVVCCDPHEGYRSAITSLLDDGGLAAEAKIAADPFHIVRLANQALTKCRQRTQTDTTGHRGRRGDPLYGARKLLLMGQERLDGAGRERLRSALGRGDPYDEVADCWEAKERVRSVFKTPDPEQAAARLDDAIEYCRAPEAAPELRRLATTLRRWRAEIITSIATSTHNGRTEAANAKIKDIKRSARGFRNLHNHRLRILLAAGRKPRQTQPVTKIRTRRPSLVA